MSSRTRRRTSHEPQGDLTHGCFGAPRRERVPLALMLALQVRLHGGQSASEAKKEKVSYGALGQTLNGRKGRERKGGTRRERKGERRRGGTRDDDEGALARREREDAGEAPAPRAWRAP